MSRRSFMHFLYLYTRTLVRFHAVTALRIRSGSASTKHSFTSSYRHYVVSTTHLVLATDGSELLSHSFDSLDSLTVAPHPLMLL
jgi:hypothetical protein